MISFLMLGSLVLGLIAWAFPIINLMQHRNNKYRKWGILSILSISACSISLYFQLFYSYHLVKIGARSALMDTSYTIAFLSAVLLVITIILNVATLILYHGKETKGL
ncbi:hypothetical protein [Tissierella praeacuta]|uniref:hypothetical protein n=1 Tax=Tissierella praeacuta TaxID=43131 RepID=UPI00333E3984